MAYQPQPSHRTYEQKLVFAFGKLFEHEYLSLELHL